MTEGEFVRYMESHTGLHKDLNAVLQELRTMVAASTTNATVLLERLGFHNEERKVAVAVLLSRLDHLDACVDALKVSDTRNRQSHMISTGTHAGVGAGIAGAIVALGKAMGWF